MRRLGPVVALMLIVQALPLAAPATQDPEDVAGEPIVGDVTWTGVVNRTAGVNVMPGSTLTIENATVLWQTRENDHFGIAVFAGGRLVIRDSHLMQGQPWLADIERTAAYWDFSSEGVIDIERALIEHNAALDLERDGVVGSRIVDTEFSWSSRGIHVLRTNLTGHDEWDLVLQNVSIHDLPIVTGGGVPDIGGAIGVLNANVLIDRVTIERVRATGLFVDHSAVARDTNQFGSRVHATNLIIVGGSPEGFDGEGKLLNVRTLGEFFCDSCHFIADSWSWITITAGDNVVISNSTGINSRVAFQLAPTDHVRLENSQFFGPQSWLYFPYANRHTPTLVNVGFDASDALGVLMQGGFPVDLRGVYWGDPSGPRDVIADDLSTPATNDGAGRRVEGPMDYRGWLTSPAAAGGDLRVRVLDAPPLSLPGSTGSVLVEVQNAGESVANVALAHRGPLDATLTPAHLALAPGETQTATLSYTIPSALAAGVSVHQTIIADDGATFATSALTTTIARANPTLRLDTPTADAALVGDVTFTGGVLEPELVAPPSGGSSAPDDTASTTTLGQLDQDGDRIDDRAQQAVGPVAVHVMVDEASRGSVARLVDTLGGRVLRQFTLVPDVYAIVDASTLPTIAAEPGVRAIWWDEPMKEQLALSTRAIRARTSQEGVLPGGAEPDVAYGGVWRGNPFDGHDGLVGRGVLVAVIDSGIDPSHQSVDDMDDDPTTVDPKVVGRISTYSVLTAGDAQLAPSSVVNPGAHGTGVAGTMGGTGQGFVGHPSFPLSQSTSEDRWLHAGAAPGARILDVDAFEEIAYPINVGGIAPSAGFGLALEGFEAVAAWNREHPDDPVRVVQISLSLGSTAVEHPVNDVANALAETGVLVVVAAGNNHEGVVAPATAPKVLAVGAVDTRHTVARGDDAKARFSDVANEVQLAQGAFKPEIMAPGVDVLIPELGTVDGYSAANGTSFAAPLVSGVAALVLEANPRLHAAQVKEILIRSSEPRGVGYGDGYTDADLDFEDDLVDGGWDPRWGFGYVDAEEAVRLARATTPRLPPPPARLDLHVDGVHLAADAPATASITSETNWTFTPVAPLRLGDGDPGTLDQALLVVDAPTATPDASVSNVTASLFVDDVLVARAHHLDNSIGLSPEDVPIRVPITLGQITAYNRSGPEGGITRVLATLDVLDAAGSLVVPAGATLRLDVEAEHTDGVAAPLVQGPGGTRISLPLDPAALANGGPPGIASGLRATWNAASASLTWGPAPDDRGIGAYEVWRDGALVGSVSGHVHQYVDATVTPGATHAYTVRAIDVHGIAGAESATLRARIPATTGREVIVTYAGDSAAATSLAPDGAFTSWTATLPAPPPGRHQARVTLFVDGEQVDETTRVLRAALDTNTPPVVTLPDLIDTLHGIREIAFDATDADGASDLVTVRARFDDKAWHSAIDRRVVLDAASLGAGAHTLTIEAIDASGATTSATRVFTVAPWTATFDAPNVLLENMPNPIGIVLSGEGAQSAALRLEATGALVATLTPTPDGSDAWRATLPPAESGFVRLTLHAGEDLIAEATRVIDRAPAALVMGDTYATRLDTLTLRDASTDDGGIAQRTWTLPNGTTIQGETLTLAPFSFGVGEHAIQLQVANVNGLTATTTKVFVIEDLPPRITATPFIVNGAVDTRAFTGETVEWTVSISDPEGDPLRILGGLAVDGAVRKPRVGDTTFTVSPQRAEDVIAHVIVLDPWSYTQLDMRLPVAANTPPTVVFEPPTLVDAGTTILLDGRGSHDPDRPQLAHAQGIEGLAQWNRTHGEIQLPLGAWNATHSVTDASGATSSATKTILADDWLHGEATFLRAPTRSDAGALRLLATWHDGSPAANARVTITVSHAMLPELTTRTYHATTDEAGRVHAALGFDAMATNLPGPHEVVVRVEHASLEDAPVQDLETIHLVQSYTI